MKTLLFKTKTKSDAVNLSTKCVQNDVSFEFLNGNEFYFTIYDDNDFTTKQNKLGSDVINLKNEI